MAKRSDIGKRKLAEAAAHLAAQQKSDRAAQAKAEASAHRNQTSKLMLSGSVLDATDNQKTKFQKDLRQAPDFFTPKKASKIGPAVSTCVPQFKK
jgi:hypothetical protein